jgi:MFS family permease
MIRGTKQQSVFAALRERDFALLWTGQTVSSVGDGIFTVVLAIEALRIDQSATGLAYVLAARAIPSVAFAIVGGVVVDRVPRRFAMLVSDVVRGLAVGAIALLVAFQTLRLGELIAMAAAFGTADAFFEELLVQGNALGQMSGQFTQSLVGPAIGGVVVAVVGRAWSFGFDAISFALSAISLAVMRATTRPERTGNSVMEDAREGLRYVRSQRWLLAQLIAAAIANLFGIAPLAVLLPLVVRHVLHGTSVELGLVFAAGGATGIIASFAVAKLGAPNRRITVMWTSYALAGAAIALMSVAPDVLAVAGLSALEIGLIVYGDVLYVSMMQSLVRADLRGRVFSVAYLLAFALTPLGILAGGVVATLIGARTALVVSGCVSGACGLVIFLPGVRDPDRADEPDLVAA